jgi:hypothetical protein
MNKKNYLPIVLLAIIVFAAWKIYGQQTKPNVKQAWEYKVCSLYRKMDAKNWIERYEDGVSVGAPFDIGAAKMKELGAAGWELVAVTSISDQFHMGYTNTNFENSQPETTPSVAGFTNEMFFYFKRLK